jgi:hypothetical protein
VVTVRGARLRVAPAAKVERLLDENLVSAASRRELDALRCAIAITRRY